VRNKLPTSYENHQPIKAFKKVTKTIDNWHAGSRFVVCESRKKNSIVNEWMKEKM
jgi:hypothetical protein